MERILFCLLLFALPFVCIEFFFFYYGPYTNPVFHGTIIGWTTYFLVKTIWKSQRKSLKNKIVSFLMILYWFLLLLFTIKAFQLPIEYRSYKLIIVVLASMVILPVTFFVKMGRRGGVSP